MIYFQQPVVIAAVVFTLAYMLVVYLYYKFIRKEVKLND